MWFKNKETNPTASPWNDFGCSTLLYNLWRKYCVKNILLAVWLPSTQSCLLISSCGDTGKNGRKDEMVSTLHLLSSSPRIFLRTWKSQNTFKTFRFGNMLWMLTGFFKTKERNQRRFQPVGLRRRAARRQEEGRAGESPAPVLPPSMSRPPRETKALPTAPLARPSRARQSSALNARAGNGFVFPCKQPRPGPRGGRRPPSPP